MNVLARTTDEYGELIDLRTITFDEYRQEIGRSVMEDGWIQGLPTAPNIAFVYSSDRFTTYRLINSAGNIVS